MAVPALRDLVRDILDLEYMGPGPEIRHECAAARNPVQVAFIGKLTQGAIGRHARHVHHIDQLVLRRHAVGRPQLARRNTLDDQVLDLLVAWLLQRPHAATPIRCSVCANACRAESRSTCSPSITRQSPLTMTRSTGSR